MSKGKKFNSYALYRKGTVVRSNECCINNKDSENSLVDNTHRTETLCKADTPYLYVSPEDVESLGWDNIVNAFEESLKGLKKDMKNRVETENVEVVFFAEYEKGEAQVRGVMCVERDVEDVETLLDEISKRESVEIS